MAFIVREGLLTSSIRYSSWREGRAINISITAGRIVQMVSKVCPSRKYRLVFVETIREARP